MQVATGDGERPFFAFSDAPGHLPAQGADLPLQVPEPRLQGVVHDDLPDHFGGNLEILGAQAVFGQLPGQEVAENDGQLLILGVARQADNLHAVS